MQQPLYSFGVLAWIFPFSWADTLFLGGTLSGNCSSHRNFHASCFGTVCFAKGISFSCLYDFALSLCRIFHDLCLSLFSSYFLYLYFNCKKRNHTRAYSPFGTFACLSRHSCVESGFYCICQPGITKKKVG